MEAIILRKWQRILVITNPYSHWIDMELGHFFSSHTHTTSKTRKKTPRKKTEWMNEWKKKFGIYSTNNNNSNNNNDDDNDMFVQAYFFSSFSSILVSYLIQSNFFFCIYRSLISWEKRTVETIKTTTITAKKKIGIFFYFFPL